MPKRFTSALRRSDWTFQGAASTLLSKLTGRPPQLSTAEQKSAKRRRKTKPSFYLPGEWREGVARRPLPRHWLDFQDLVLALRARL